jgi:uncharacterized protein
VNRLLTVNPVIARHQQKRKTELSSARLLLDMQQIDQRLAKNTSEFKKLASQLDSEGDLKRLKEESEAARVRVLETRLEFGKLEAETASLKERLKDIESRLYGGAITNLRELTALEEEHNHSKRALATAEEAVSPARLASQEAQARHEQLQNDLAESEEKWKATSRELKQRARTVSKICKSLEIERNEASSHVDQQSLALYRNLLPRKGGVAVARVERGICQGCRIKLPIREIAQLKNEDNLVMCSSCGRILLTT